jgi:hypothetical protein
MERERKERVLSACGIASWSSLSIPQLPDRHTFLFVTVNQAWRYFAAPVLRGYRWYRNEKGTSRALSHYLMTKKGGISYSEGLPLWSSGQSSGYRSRGPGFWVPAPPDFLRSNGSGTRSTQPAEVNWGATWMEKERLRSRKPKLTAVGIRCADHATPSIR